MIFFTIYNHIIPPVKPILERASAYLAKMPAALSGQGAHSAIFDVAVALVKGFGLSPEEALPLLDQVLQVTPQDVDAQGALRLQVRKLLEGDAALARELEALLASVAQPQAGPKIVQTGDGNRAALVVGQGHKVSVS